MQPAPAYGSAGFEAPPMAEPPPRRRKVGGLVLTIVGAAVFGAGYVGAVASYLLSEAMGESAFDAQLLIPIAGPWLTLGSTDWDRVLAPEEDKVVDKFVLVMQGLLQAVGPVLLVIGLSKRASSESATGPLTPQLAVGFSPVPGGFVGTLSGRL